MIKAKLAFREKLDHKPIVVDAVFDAIPAYKHLITYNVGGYVLNGEVMEIKHVVSSENEPAMLWIGLRVL